MNLNKHKPTFFSVFSIIGILAGIPLGIYTSTLKYGASLHSVIFYCAVIGFLILLILDRILVTKISPMKLSVMELSISIIVLLIFLIKMG